jgi:hypothetical protein
LCSVTVRWQRALEITALQVLRNAAKQLQGRETREQTA